METNMHSMLVQVFLSLCNLSDGTRNPLVVGPPREAAFITIYAFCMGHDFLLTFAQHVHTHTHTCTFHYSNPHLVISHLSEGQTSLLV